MLKMTTCAEVEKEICTGCGVCMNICPAKAVYMDIDEEGFWYPQIMQEKCFHCGKCVKVCPVSGAVQAGTEMSVIKKQPKVYAAWSLNKEIRYHSTSGGIFSELALSVLEIGGYICGAIYDEHQTVRHYITNKEQELDKVRQSKYVQSDMKDIYVKIGRLLTKGEVLLFCGAPCQCQGVLNYCKENDIDTAKLSLADFICRGSNSPKVYKKFLEELETEYQAEVDKVWFKNKTYGWNRFSTRIDFKDGKYYLQDRYHDTYIRGYIEENLFIRPACANCGFKGLNRSADITLADFWGVQLKEERMQETDKGTSLVMIHTEKGKKLWNSIRQNIYQTSKKLEDVRPGNSCFEYSVRQGEHREQFMKDLDSMPVIANISRFLKKTREAD